MLYKKLTNKIFIVLSAITSLFLLNALVFSAGYFKNATKEYSFTNLVSVTLCFLAQFVLVFALFKFINKLEKKQLRLATYLLFAVFIVLEAVFLLFVYTIPNTDAYRCIDTAIGFANGSYPIVDEAHPHYWYFCDFSNNNFFTMILFIYFRVFHITTNYVFLTKLLNAVLIFVAILFAFKSAKLLLGQKNAVKTLALFTLNPVFYTHIQWIYTLTFSLPVMMAIIYFGLRVLKETSLKKQVIFSSLIGLFSAIGYLIRPTSVFPLIAIIIYTLSKIKFNKDFFKKAGAVSLSLLLTVSLSFLALNSFTNSRFEKTLKYNFPLTHWIMMGITNDGILDTNDVMLTRSFGETKAQKQKGNIEEIKKRLSQKSGIELIKHFEKKIQNTFSDGTYNIATRYKSTYAYSKLKTYTTGQKSALFTLYCQGFKVFSLTFSILGIFFIIKKKKYSLMPLVITILGGFIFYIFWESKQSYSLPFLLEELILCVFAISVFDNVKVFETKPKKIATLLACFALILAIIFVPHVKLRELKSANLPINLFSVKDINYISKGEIKQEFVSNTNVKKIAILANKANKNTIAKIRIVDENEKTVFTDTLLQDRFKIVKKRTKQYNRCVLKIENQKIQKNKKYTIIINSKNINWFQKKSFGIDCYEGDFYINNQKLLGDLMLTIYQ